MGKTKIQYFVYKHITPNSKCYIGITSKIKVENRWLKGNGYKRKDKNGNYSHFYKAIQKYGWDNIEHKVLAHGLTKEQAKRWETILIKHYRSDNPKFGYNKTKGGEDNTLSEEILDKYLRKQVVCLDTLVTYNSIKEASKELNVDSSAISKICLKKLKSVHGLHFMFKSEFIHTDKEAISDLIKYNKNSVKIICYETKEIFYSIFQASKNYNISRTSISNCLNNRSRTAGGYHWFYYDYWNKNKYFIDNKLNETKVCYNNKPVVLLNDCSIYLSCTEASIKFNIDITTVANSCKNKFNNRNGLKFMYLSDVIKNIILLTDINLYITMLL